LAGRKNRQVAREKGAWLDAAMEPVFEVRPSRRRRFRANEKASPSSTSTFVSTEFSPVTFPSDSAVNANSDASRQRIARKLRIVSRLQIMGSDFTREKRAPLKVRIPNIPLELGLNNRDFDQFHKCFQSIWLRIVFREVHNRNEDFLMLRWLD
jgi:hypothetical protein